MDQETKLIAVRIPILLAEKLQQWALRMRETEASIVERALSEWIEDEEEEMRLILGRLADIDAGRVVSHETVRAWMEIMLKHHQSVQPTEQ